MSKTDEAGALFALSRLEKRERLLKLVRGNSNRHRIQVFLAAVLFFAVILLFRQEEFLLPTLLMIIPILILFAAETERQRKQIDAIAELIESECINEPNA